MMRSMKMIAMMRKMDTMMEADPRDKSSTKTRCNMLPNINSLCMLKKRSNEESMLCTVLSSLLTPDQARKITLITPSKTASESAQPSVEHERCHSAQQPEAHARRCIMARVIC